MVTRADRTVRVGRSGTLRSVSVLTVAVDTGPLVGARTGIGRFTAELVEALAGLDDAPTLRPYVLSFRAELAPGTVRLAYPAGLAQRVWTWFDHPVPRRAFSGCDVVHGTNFVVPPTRSAAVVTVHDCSPLDRPDLVDPVVRRFPALIARAVARGAWVHTPSQYVADQVRERFGTERVRAVWHGGPRLGEAPSRRPPLPGLDGRPYVLGLGTREPRKNLVRLVQAFGSVRASGHDVGLVLVGKPGSDAPNVDAAIAALPPSAAERVVVTEFVTDEQLVWLLAHASVLAYPSLDEGFGLPLLEAMSYGVPVVASAAGALPEVAGDAAVLVPPLDVDALAGALVTTLTDDDHRARLIAAGHVRRALFSWAATAEAFVGLYRQALDDRR